MTRSSHLINLIVLGVLAAALLVAVMPVRAAGLPPCSFKFGFKALHDLIPDVVGNCTEDERMDAATGDVVQNTENGRLRWTKATNLVTFTDGPNTYMIGPEGLATRPTDGPKFPWEDSPRGPSAAGRPPQPSPIPVGQNGTVLLRENFDDPTSKWCSDLKTIAVPGLAFGCADGEMRIHGQFRPTYTVWVLGPTRYGNTSLAVDTRLVGGSEQRQILLYCRDQGVQSLSRYELYLTPSLQRFFMGRMLNGEWETLARGESTAINPGGETNRIELTCAGDLITGSVNGTELGLFNDNAFRSGGFGMGAANYGDVELPIDVRFDNFVMTER